MTPSKVYYTTPHHNFITCFAAFLAKAPETLSTSTIIFPSHRASLQFKSALFKHFPRGLLLPKLLSLNDTPALLEHFGICDMFFTKPIPSALKETILSLLIRRWKHHLPSSHIDGYRSTLQTTLDELMRFGVDPEALPLSNENLRFLATTLEHYPKIIEELGFHDPLHHQERLVTCLLRALKENPTTSPLWVAGLSQFLPHTLHLMKGILQDRNGYVAIPFVEKDQDSAPLSSPHFHVQKILRELSFPLSPLSQEEASTTNITSLQTKSPLHQAQAIATLAQTLKGRVAIALPSTESQFYVEGALQSLGLSFNSSLPTPFPHTEIGKFLSLTLSFLKTKEIPEYAALTKHPYIWNSWDKEQRGAFYKFIKNTTTTPQASLSVDHHDLSFDPLVLDLLKSSPLHAMETFTRMHIKDSTTLDIFWSHVKETLSHTKPYGDQDWIETAHLVLRNMPDSPSPPSPSSSIHLMGLMEARLCDFDHLIIADMNEGVVPRSLSPSPWLSPSLKKSMGLLTEEEYLGLQEQDFLLSLTCAPNITLFYTESRGRDASLPSPFLSKVEHLKREAAFSPIVVDGVFHPQHPDKSPPRSQHKPTRLSVTAIQSLMTNPYGFYARYILNLRPRESLSTLSLPLVLGQALHEALDIYSKEKYGFVEGSHEILYQLFKKSVEKAHLSLTPLLDIRLLSIAKELCRERNPLTLQSELEGELNIGEITIYARLDALVQNTGTLLDYKTGSVPTQTEITKGMAPQLPLEGVIFQNADIQNLCFVKLQGKKPYVEWIPVKDPQKRIEEASLGVHNILNTYIQDSFEFISVPNNNSIRRPYKHLERLSQ